MTLDELPVGRSALVTRLVAEADLRERLAELGFTTGARVRMRARALFGDPLQVVVRGSTFAVRAVEARCVQLADASVGTGGFTRTAAEDGATTGAQATPNPPGQRASNGAAAPGGTVG